MCRRGSWCSARPKDGCTGREAPDRGAANDFSRPGWQIERLRVILHALRGCKTLVLSRITTPQRLLIEARGIRVLEASGFVEEA